MAKNILEILKKHRLYFDGGTGTVLQGMGLPAGTPPEIWNIEAPEKIIALHKDYINAGCNIINTNTFGINADKYENYEELIKGAFDCINAAKNGADNVFVSFDVGPTGRLLKPLGDMDFEEAVELFAKNIRCAEKYGADLITIETMNDSYETKAAVIAAKENSNLPIFVTNVYDESKKLMTGASPQAMIALLEGLGVDALGMNCSLGPDKMLDVLEDFLKYSSLPIIVNPNAGLPAVVDGKTVYTTDADEFSDYMIKMAEKGATILGGCCGTTPEYMKKMIEKTKNLPYTLPSFKTDTLVSSYTHAVRIGKAPVLIGERLNPTGKAKLKAALKENNLSYLANEAVMQEEAGVHILDLNVGLPEIDEVKMLKSATEEVQTVTNLPLQLDSANPKALEAAMRIYNGKPLVNSVNGEKDKLDAVLPLVKKYGGTLIALTMDENGIPDSADERLEIVKKIAKEAAKYGIDKKDIIVDPLALTVSADTKNALITLETVKKVKEMGFCTSLGVSNISFGLPKREKINSAFFALALENGLDCAIMNPFSKSMLDVYYSFKVLHNMDESCGGYINYVSQTEEESEDNKLTKTDKSSGDIKYFIQKGMKKAAGLAAQELIEVEKPIDIINNYIIPALNQVGSDFEQKKVYLPQLLASAEAASVVFEVVKEKMPKTNQISQNKIVLATVKGDIHDIGKNIVKVLLESYGFLVIDLGRDVPPEVVVEAALKNDCRLVGLSALMTTTVPTMEETIKLVHETDPDIKVIVGGAVLNDEYAKMIDADFYAEDAMTAVNIAKKFFD
ncbi:MAG: homocysteine S-methyltransferase family protein [Clostridia bacterium]|nr:homocysteine S-methyltransferase family protein [Clostridia bacterium]